MLVNEIENSVIRGMTIDGKIARAIVHVGPKRIRDANPGPLLLVEPQVPLNK
jgi:hypothetical protein